MAMKKKMTSKKAPANKGAKKSEAGLTASQKKLPPFIKAAILKKKKKK